MSKSYKSWTIYSVGLFVVWVLIFLARWKLKGTPGLDTIALIFFGYFVGWLSATIKFVLISKGIFGLTSFKSGK